jgi:glycosyltransferase involved in cell wall biosynthesis
MRPETPANIRAPLPLSLLVLTYNEADNIARCLDSVPFARDKLVIDCGSTDATIEIASAHGARVVHQPWLGFGPQRRAATRLARYPWILFLDADEWLSPELARERIERLYHRERAQWTEASVHEALEFQAPAIDLRAPLLHAYTPTLLQRSIKDLYYAELRAREWAARGRPSRLWLAPLVFLSTFLKDYLLRLGVLDGARGYIAAHLAASYAVYKRLRRHEMLLYPESVEMARAALVRHGIERSHL